MLLTFMTSNGNGYDLAFANSPSQFTSSDSTDTSFSEVAANPNECENEPKLKRLRARARRQRRNPQEPVSCPAKLEIPYTQPAGQNSGEPTEPNIRTHGGKQPTDPIPEPWLIPVPEPKWAGYNPTCFSKTYGLLPLAVCDSSPYQLPSSYDLHGEPNLAFSQPPKWDGPRQPGDIGPQPVQLGIDLNKPKSWQLNNAWLGMYFPAFQFPFPNFFFFFLSSSQKMLSFLIFTTHPPSPHPLEIFIYIYFIY